jgi:hypothetical protein
VDGELTKKSSGGGDVVKGDAPSISSKKMMDG